MGDSTTSAFWAQRRVLVTGGAGFIGSHVVERLASTRGVPLQNIVVPRSAENDLRNLEDCRRVIEGCDVVIHLAAVTGGIAFSRAHPASQYRDSTLIDLNVVEAARRAKVQKLVAIGNLFAYAGNAPVPLVEESMFDGLPTDLHRGVGWMKRNLALVADLNHREFELPMCVVYSANAYGPGDSTDRNHSHVIPATIMKCLLDDSLTVWGDGSPTRDFLFVQDVAEALLLAAERLSPPSFVNVGSGNEISIRDLVGLIAKHTGFRGSIHFDASKAGGDARRCTSVARSRELLGFAPAVSMDEGIRRTVEWYRAHLRPAA